MARPHSYAAVDKVKRRKSYRGKEHTDTNRTRHERVFVDYSRFTVVWGIHNPRFNNGEGVV